MKEKPPFEIRQMAYVGIGTTVPETWRAFAAGYLGMQAVETEGGTLAMRMDERQQRMLILPALDEGLQFIGLELDDAATLHNAATVLTNAGLALAAGKPSECAQRGVEALQWFCDPDGHRIELFHGPLLARQAFQPGRPIGGFRTGDLGFGHMVLQTPNYPSMKKLYMDLLGFRLSDYMHTPFAASFMHVNARHHSLALLTSPEARLHHLMVEYLYVDDIGRLYDMALEEPDRIAVTMGRHTNDHMLSFYSRTPGGFMIETGWAGRLIDDATWQPEELSAPSIWGHERSWLPPDVRERARHQRDALAAQGILAPTAVYDLPGFALDGLNTAKPS